ncbi:MAG: hypothetical protein Kow00114_00830 [Kiloniellaceae bacterium]
MRFIVLIARLIAGLAVAAALLPAPLAAQPSVLPQLASEDHPMPVDTDFNLVTAIDVSDSITRHDEWLQYSGLARGVLDAEFLARISGGLQRRIGFVAFTWSSGGEINVVVPWTVIETRADAQAVAARFDAAPRIDRRGFGMYRPGSSSVDVPRGGLTDITEAVESAVQLSLNAPFPARRTVINILSNGVDNNGRDPRLVRDRAISLGMTVNGVVFGGSQGLPDYFRDHVIGGPGAFLMTVQQPGDLRRALEKKFWLDLIAGLAATTAG